LTGCGAADEQPASAEVEAYRYQPHAKPKEVAKNVEVEEVEQNGQRFLLVNTLEDGAVPMMFDPSTGQVYYPDVPGSTNIRVTVNKEFGYTTLAGLRFKDDAVVNIRPDGAVEIDREGVRAEDDKGISYVATSVGEGDKAAVILIKHPLKQEPAADSAPAPTPVIMLVKRPAKQQE
jgi:hypothetical protein